jgi:hypothetical protein
MAKSKPSKKKKKDKKKVAAKQAKADGRRMVAAKHAKADGKGKVKAKPAASKAAAGKAAEPGPAKGRLEPKAKGAEHEKGAARPTLGPNGKPVKERAKARKSSRRPTLLRRGPDGEILAPGDLLLPGGTQRAEEIQYLFRGWAAAEHSTNGEDAITEVFARRPLGEFPSGAEDLQRALAWAHDRFERGNIEPVIPPRANLRRSFQGVVERARHRRREIGAFLRGLDVGRTETSHMDAHGEASLQGLMEWAARLENLAEADEPTQADYNQFHRGLDQLESTTEALIIDVEQTLRRLRDRIRG